MNILISPVSQIPIYKQIEDQISEQILSGELPKGTKLPSIRLLSKELQIGIITIKRAYEDLCNEGLLTSIAGKGIYVSEIDLQYVNKINTSTIKDLLRDIKNKADSYGFCKQELITLIEDIYMEDK